jgi:GAF domain-containing protein
VELHHNSRIVFRLLAVACVVMLVAGVLIDSALLAAASAALAVGLLLPLTLPHHASPATVPVDNDAAGSDRPQPEPAAPSAGAPIPGPMELTRAPISLEPEAVLGAVADAVASAGDPLAVSLWLDDEASSTIRHVAAVGTMPPSSQPITREGDDPIARACSDGAAHLEQVALVRGRGEPLGLWRFALPLTAGAHHGAVAIDLGRDGAPDAAFLPRATAPLRAALAGALALHISRAELETARELVGIARSLSRVLDPREVLALALEHAMHISDAATGSVMLLEEESGRLTIAESVGLPADVVERTTLSTGEGIAGWVLATGQPLLVEDLPARTPAARRHGVRSAVSVPIADDDGTLGVLNVGSRSFPARFTDSHLAALELLGRQTATALRNARAIGESRALYFDTLKALALALETKDPYSSGSTERVLELADALGDVFSLPAEERDALRIAALLHDIGMASVGEAVVASDKTLTTVERALLKLHPQIAADILAEAPALRRVVPIVYHHHEWYDGTGYVGGATGEGIPLGARILSVADAYVAMTSDRPYRSAMNRRDALRELRDKAGTQFDPAVVDAMLDIMRDGSNRVPGPDRER